MLKPLEGLQVLMMLRRTRWMKMPRPLQKELEGGGEGEEEEEEQQPLVGEVEEGVVEVS